MVDRNMPRISSNKEMSSYCLDNFQPYTRAHSAEMQRFLKLKSGRNIQAEYVWIGGAGELRALPQRQSPLHTHPKLAHASIIVGQ